MSTGYVRNHGTCGICGKVNFGSRQSGRDVIRRLMQKGAKRRDRTGDPLRVYRSCDRSSFHVGHTGSMARPNLNEPTLRWIEG